MHWYVNIIFSMSNMIDGSIISTGVRILGIVSGIASFIIISKKRKIYFGCIDYLINAFLAILTGAGLWMITLCSFSLAAARLMVIESETSHPIYFVYGEEKKKYLIDLESGNIYVQNQMNRSILIHTIPRKDNNTEFPEWIVLRPNQISEVRYAPVFFFDKNAPTYSRPRGVGEGLPWNAVDYYND